MSAELRIEVTTVDVWDDKRITNLWRSVFGSSGETYPWWRDLWFKDGSDWDKPGPIELTVEDPERTPTSFITKKLGPEDVVRAFLDMRNQSITCFGRPVCEDPEVWDADMADQVLQWLMFGEIVYG